MLKYQYWCTIARDGWKVSDSGIEKRHLLFHCSYIQIDNKTSWLFKQGGYLIFLKVFPGSTRNKIQYFECTKNSQRSLKPLKPPKQKTFKVETNKSQCCKLTTFSNFFVFLSWTTNNLYLAFNFLSISLPEEVKSWWGTWSHFGILKSYQWNSKLQLFTEIFAKAMLP